MSELADYDDKILDPDWYKTREDLKVLKRFSAEDPVHWTHAPTYGHDFWFITGYENVRDYLLDHENFSSRWDGRIPKTPKRYTPEQRYEMGFDVSMARNDPPIHDLYRKPVNKHFSVPAVRKMKGDIDRIVDELLNDVAERGECDLAADIAAELPARVILRLLGVPEEDWDHLQQSAWRWLSPGDPSLTIDGDLYLTSRTGHNELLDYCERLAMDRRENPRDDFASVLTQVRVDDDPLTVHELRSYFTIMIGGGLDTTRNTTAVGMHAFLTNPDQAQLLRDDPSLAFSAVEEVMRWVTPSRTRFRVAARDFEFRGRDIRAGDWVIASATSANRDERVFTDPDRFDIRRNPNPHLGFGEGIHQCLGRNLVRLELAAIFPKVVERFPDMEPVGEPEWLPDYSSVGFLKMPVRYSPALVPVGAR
ncbi:cytochrome P450 [Salinibacterium sp. ZJ454]|uniref:cytochrome P450 n=1 Tax=Salinibacterium sp. ZJ454 TaxID=2708339 RepID=UPI001421940E|nr:cytochrome P450 [Salinibacterium sp. ZJ454]